MINKIVINDLELKSENGYYIQSVKDLGYKTKYPIGKVLYTHGAKLGDVYFENKILAVELKVGGSTVNEFIDRRSALYKALTLNEFGTDILDFEFHLSNNIVLIAQGVIKDINSDIGVDNLTTGDITFAIEMEEPFFKTQQTYQSIFSITKGGGCAVPMAIPLDMSQGAAGYPQIFNGGNVFVFPEIYFYGTLTNPILENITSGKQIALDAEIASDEYIYVDTYNRIVKDDSNVNKRDKMTGDFLVLNVGENNFKLSSDNAAEDGYIKLIYKYYFISI